MTNSDAWYVQQIIDNLRIPHDLTLESSYDEVMEFFTGLSAIIKDLLPTVGATISISMAAPMQVISITGETAIKATRETNTSSAIVTSAASLQAYLAPTILITSN